MKAAAFLYAVLISLAGVIGYLWYSESAPGSKRQTQSATAAVVQTAVPSQATTSGHSLPQLTLINANFPSPAKQPVNGPEDFASATLWGTIKTDSADFIPGQELKLYSPSLNQQHIAISNDYGEFVINGIKPAIDYRISVKPRGMFQRYENIIEIHAHQINTTVVLRELPVGLLAGRIVDIEGDSVPGLTLVIKSLSKPRWASNVTTDQNGQFALDNVPQGKIEVSSRASHLLNATGIYFTSGSEQLLRITGVDFVVGANAVLNIVVDSGPHAIRGRVQDEFGEPLAGVSVLLDWVHSEGLLRSVSARRTLTDFNGEFSIDGLGSGLHELVISSSGIGASRRSINVGYDSGQIEAVLTLAN